MDTNATNGGRFSRIGSTAPTTRIGRRHSALAPGDAVAGAESAEDRDDRPPERDNKARQDIQQNANYAISPETQLVLLTSTDTDAPARPLPGSRRVRIYGDLDTTSEVASALPKATRFNRTV
jgi:hypothetical protein